MTEPTSDPPLVTRPDPPADASAPEVPARPRPGFREAVLWCAVFVAVQMTGAVVTVAGVFAAYAAASPEPGKFVDEQLSGFTKALDPKGEGERVAMPFEFGQARAWGMPAAQFAALGLIALVLPRRIGPDWKRQIGFRAPHPLHVLLVLLLVPGFMIASDLIQTVFLWLTGMKPPSALKAVNGVFGRFPWPLTVLAVALGPGVVEELWCRGFVGRGLLARYGAAAGVLLTAGLFAAMHLDPSQLVVITCMGAYLHFVYLATRSIWAPVLLHAANNAVAILIALVFKPGDGQGNVEVPVIVYVVTLALVLFGSVALWTSRAEPDAPGDARPRYGAVSPAALLFTFVSFGALAVLAARFAR